MEPGKRRAPARASTRIASFASRPPRGANLRPEDDEPWKQKLIYVERKGERELAKILANVATILENDAPCIKAIAYNEFTHEPSLVKAPPWDLVTAVPRPWSDADNICAEEWLERAWNLPTNTRTVHDAAIAVASRNSFHPVRDYLDNLEWDRTERLGAWLSTYCGAEPTEYVAAVGRKWLISGVARIYKPGAKADHMLILEGPQGHSKSSACEAIAGDHGFTDELDSIGSKDAALQMQGVLIVELGELAAMARSEVERVKQWLVRRSDRFRAPYGRHVRAWPRQCIFVGTVNPGGNGYLRDETGNRRFWPVSVGSIDLAGIRGDRDQLWAEAVHAYKAGETWWLDTDQLIDAARSEQDSRFVADAWEDVIAAGIAGKSRVSVGQVLKEILHIDEDRWSQADQTRVAKVLRRLGRERKQVREGDVRKWIYIEPEPDL